ncbi:hypothetical protein BC792_11264 [Sphingobacterium allocomposti]|uniref:Uncharacterized protein n=1 Tax=Sphingobacterium allocomposti TaxID=415956 RepID=A0A5S5DED7_9SPHI|nr:hypothetical protein BC792_11264 [Sphingobacterium composti Yoo et al. 2007 non Ten et al. 2007]
MSTEYFSAINNKVYDFGDIFRVEFQEENCKNVLL